MLDILSTQMLGQYGFPGKGMLNTEPFLYLYFIVLITTCVSHFLKIYVYLWIVLLPVKLVFLCHLIHFCIYRTDGILGAKDQRTVTSKERPRLLLQGAVQRYCFLFHFCDHALVYLIHFNKFLQDMFLSATHGASSSPISSRSTCST
jgi:hypothetical protein